MNATLWNHFILASTVARHAGAKAARASFRYVDTHAGTEGGAYPGSWVLAGRVADAAAPEVEVELDVNDLAEAVVIEARRHREAGWTRFWSHDWFLFLRTRLGVGSRPDFVFIDPPADDPRGHACGVLLGGGAEAVVLHLLPDLRRLAGLLGGELSVRLPRGDDYVI